VDAHISVSEKTWIRFTLVPKSWSWTDDTIEFTSTVLRPANSGILLEIFPMDKTIRIPLSATSILCGFLLLNLYSVVNYIHYSTAS